MGPFVRGPKVNMGLDSQKTLLFYSSALLGTVAFKRMTVNDVALALSINGLYSTLNDVRKTQLEHLHYSQTTAHNRYAWGIQPKTQRSR